MLSVDLKSIGPERLLWSIQVCVMPVFLPSPLSCQRVFFVQMPIYPQQPVEKPEDNICITKGKTVEI